MATSSLSYSSPLHRKKWVKDNLLKHRHKSFWTTFTGKSSDSIVYQERNTSASTGHTVVFDFSGKLTGKAYRGSDYTTGRGEVKRRFSSQITVDEYNFYVDNGSKFDAYSSDNLAQANHSDSISKLSDLFMRHKDQGIYDVMQGIFQKPSHILNLGTTFSYDDLIRIENAGKTGEDLVVPDANGIVSNTAAIKRGPLDPYSGGFDEPTYLCIIDNYMATRLKRDSNYQTIITNADVRGPGNRTIKLKVGKLGNVIYIEAPVFFGNSGDTIELFGTEIQFSGLRRYARDTDGAMYWEGQVGFELVRAKLQQDIASGTTTNYDNGARIFSRGMLLGAGAVQWAIGKDADYLLEWGPFKKTSTSNLEFWGNMQKTRLTVETGTDYAGKVANIDYGIINIDLEHELL